MEDLRQTIETILWGKSFVDIPTSEGKIITFILRSLSIRESNYSNYIYRRELNAALHEGILTDEQLTRLFSAQGLWTENHEKEMKDWESKEKICQSQIKDFEFLTAKRKKAEKDLESVREKLRTLRETKLHLFSSSAEQRASEVQRRYIVMLSTETIKEEPYWTNEENFLAETDTWLVARLALAYYKHNIFDEALLRKVARCGEWRVKWSASKNGADLFGRSIPEWSEMQNMLVYWSQFYDYVYESLEKPSDNIIENDEACDAWVRDQSKKAKSSGSSKKNILGNKKASVGKDHREQFVMVQPGDQEAIKKVQDMNPTDVRLQLQREHAIIKQGKGRITEWQLRGKEAYEQSKT